MKWDIDKALTELAAPGVMWQALIARAMVDRALWKKYNLNPKSVEAGKESILCWSLGLGRWHDPKIIIYALTIRELYLRARKIIKGLSTEEADYYGVKGKPKRKKFERRERKPKKPVDPKQTKKGPKC
jgi:hypothetical protein